MKRLSLYVVILLLMTTIAAYANEGYKIDKNESILESTELSDNKAEVYTAVYGDYYKKTIEKENEKWIIKENKKIKLYPTGLKIDKDIKKNHVVEEALEKKLRSMRYGLNGLPNKIDLSGRGYLPTVKLQYGNSCVGWSVGYYLRTFQQAKDFGWEVGENEQHIFSPNFIYNQINGGVDGGATLSDGGKLLKEIGAATLYDFPIDLRDYLTQPSDEIKKKALPHKIRDWYRLYTRLNSGEEIVRKTKEYLNTGDLPVVGLYIGAKWMKPLIMEDGTSIVTTESSPIGGHAVAVVGYDDTLFTPEGYGAFKIVNSYGEGWGDKGYTYMTYEAFKNAVISGYVYTDLKNEEIVEPTPEPQLEPVVETIPVEVKINDTVDFEMKFSGSGRYDISIKDEQENVVKEYLDQNGKEGQSRLTWDGTDKDKNTANNGNYQFVITPYRGEAPQKPTVLDFVKKSKVEEASAKGYKTDGVVSKLDVNVKAKEDGQVSVYAIGSDQNKILIISGDIKAQELKTYTIDNTKVNLSDEGLYIKVMIKQVN